MGEPKTRPTGESIAAYLAAVQPDQRREDCLKLVEIMERLSSEPATMWGTSIVGFGTCTSPSGGKKPVPWPRVGFSPRKTSITIYVMPGFEPLAGHMAELGKYTTGQSCLYLRKLADVDMGVLEGLIRQSLAIMRDRYPAD